MRLQIFLFSKKTETFIIVGEETQKTKLKWTMMNRDNCNLRLQKSFKTSSVEIPTWKIKIKINLITENVFFFNSKKRQFFGERKERRYGTVFCQVLICQSSLIEWKLFVGCGWKWTPGGRSSGRYNVHSIFSLCKNNHIEFTSKWLFFLLDSYMCLKTKSWLDLCSLRGR